MPRYFFHVFDDAVSRDDEGIDLADAEAARQAAVAGIRDMICEDVRQGRLCLRHRVEIQDEQGGPVMVLTFGDAVTVDP